MKPTPKNSKKNPIGFGSSSPTGRTPSPRRGSPHRNQARKQAPESSFRVSPPRRGNHKRNTQEAARGPLRAENQSPNRLRRGRRRPNRAPPELEPRQRSLYSARQRERMNSIFERRNLFVKTIFSSFFNWF